MKIPSLTALTCQNVVEMVAEYLAGEMTAQDTARLEQHFHACTWCAVYVEQLRLTSKALGQPASEPASQAGEGGSRERLIAHFRRSKGSR
jgi:hypothetical protein